MNFDILRFATRDKKDLSSKKLHNPYNKIESFNLSPWGKITPDKANEILNQCREYIAKAQAIFLEAFKQEMSPELLTFLNDIRNEDPKTWQPKKVINTYLALHAFKDELKKPITNYGRNKK